MNLASPLRVALTAANTPAGDSADQTATSIRANVLRVREDDRYLTIAAEGLDPEPARTTRAPGVDPALDGRDRLFALLDPVMADLFERAPHLGRDAHKALLYVSLPASDRVTDTWGLESFAPDLARRLNHRFASVHASRAGSTGVFSLIAEARALIARGDAEMAIVAGVDSLSVPSRLPIFDEAGRLVSPRSRDGFFPGEGAAAVLLESERRLAARGAKAELTLLGIGVGAEPATLTSDLPSTGRGLTDALRGALADGPSPRSIVCDFNGESYRGYEWGVVHARLAERLDAIEVMSHPARSTGDLGAATGALHVVFAAASFRRGFARGDEVLAYTASDGPERAALRLGRP